MDCGKCKMRSNYRYNRDCDHSMAQIIAARMLLITLFYSNIIINRGHCRRSKECFLSVVENRNFNTCQDRWRFRVFASITAVNETRLYRIGSLWQISSVKLGSNRNRWKCRKSFRNVTYAPSKQFSLHLEQCYYRS